MAMRMAGAWISIAIAVITGWRVVPTLLGWVAVDCLDISGPSSGDEFVRFGIQGFDNFVCTFTYFFKSCQGIPTEIIARLTNCLIVSCFIAIYLFVTIESTRKMARGFCAWPTVTGTLCQTFGVSFIIPALWLPSFFYSFEQPLCNPRQRRVSLDEATLGSAMLLSVIAIGALLLMATFLALSVTEGYLFQVIFVVFQFLPTVYPLLWPLVRLVFSNPTLQPTAETSSIVASAIYRFVALVLSLHHWVAFVTPIALMENKRETVASWIHFIVEIPSNKDHIPQWFLFYDAFSVLMCMSLIVFYENAASRTVLHGAKILVQFLLMGFIVSPGAAFCLFCATREDAIRHIHFSKLKDH